jgi:hypothetical protein
MLLKYSISAYVLVDFLLFSLSLFEFSFLTCLQLFFYSLSLRPTQNLKEFSVFGFSCLWKNPSARCTSLANVVFGDIGVFRTQSVCLTRFYVI